MAGNAVAKTMEIAIQITGQPITVGARPRETCSGEAGALAEFFGIVRDRENGQPISALEYEAYTPMAENEMRRILQTLAEKHPCLAAQVVHRVGVIPVGETAIYLGVTAKHRGEAFAVITEFMNRLKQDVPIWKARALPVPNTALAAAACGMENFAASTLAGSTAVSVMARGWVCTTISSIAAGWSAACSRACSARLASTVEWAYWQQAKIL